MIWAFWLQVVQVVIHEALDMTLDTSKTKLMPTLAQGHSLHWGYILVAYHASFQVQRVSEVQVKGVFGDDNRRFSLLIFSVL